MRQRDSPISGVLVQDMVTDGVEVIIGVSYDAQLGPVLLFGTGGVMVEVYDDVAVRHCPLTLSESQAMLSEVKGARLLRGFRGDAVRSKTDTAMANEAMCKVLAHNLVVLIHEMYELGIEPAFWAKSDPHGATPA